jgi:hypothetical protein
MAHDQSMFEGTAPAEQKNAAGTFPYAGSAALGDVLLEQLEYLIAHSSQPCPSGCRDCARLRQVENWLLKPFRDFVREATAAT